MQLLWCAICYLCDALHSVIISEHIGHLATAAIVSCAICRPCPWPCLPVQCSGHLLLARCEEVVASGNDFGGRNLGTV